MAKRQLALLVVAVFLAAFLSASANSGRVSAWSNGGYSADPTHPGYGTHDWVAEHALDWLPAEEKQFLTDNLAWYLYGTELPDNGQAVGGVGDTTKHHVYFAANGGLQDGVAGVRAREEYVAAQQAFGLGNFSAAAMHLGMVAHYVGDLAVFGHVMGASTAWGTEVHHSDYESYVLRRTESYGDEFGSYLVYDGALTVTGAYDAAVGLARDTTFDLSGGGLNCTWMDQNYNWSDQTFRNRMGESLNLAVNAVADVLHTFYTETVIPEFPSTLTVTLIMMPIIAGVLLYTKKKTKNQQPFV